MDEINLAVREPIARRGNAPSTTSIIIIVAVVVVGILLINANRYFVQSTDKIKMTSTLSLEQEKVVEGFLQDALDEKYIPNNMSFRYVKTPSGRDVILTVWAVDKTEFILSYNATSKLNIVSLTTNTINRKNLTATNALPEVIGIFKVDMKCNYTNEKICESFWTDSGGNKRGFFLTVVKVASGNYIVSHTCLIPQGSEFYGLESCTVMRSSR